MFVLALDEMQADDGGEHVERGVRFILEKPADVEQPRPGNADRQLTAELDLAKFDLGKALLEAVDLGARRRRRDERSGGHRGDQSQSRAPRRQQ